MFRYCRNISIDELTPRAHAEKRGLRPYLEELEDRCVFAPVIVPAEGSTAHGHSFVNSDHWVPRAPLNYHDVVLSSELGNTVSAQIGELEHLQTFTRDDYPHHDLIHLVDGSSVEFWSNSNGEAKGIWRSYEANGTRITEKVGIPVISAGRIEVGNVPVFASPLDSGGYAVIWSDALGIHGQVFPHVDASSGISFSVAQVTLAPPNAMDIVPWSQGFSVAWSDPASGSIFLQAFDDAGVTVGSTQTVHEGALSTGGVLDLQWTRENHDVAILAWSELNYQGGTSQLQHLTQRWHQSVGAMGGIVDLGSSERYLSTSLAVDRAGRWGILSNSVDEFGSTKIV
jgi:hypothetical protein